ncbi:hypothetical protein BDR04DRAFT_1055334 [Suillus decipiens]|nr:hypothetical protein BDR04DRAFT_1055334 [Suillus decipiens]
MKQLDSPPPYYPSSSEADPLIGRRKPLCRQSIYVYAVLSHIVLLVVVVIIALTSLIFSIRPSNDPLNPDNQDRIRMNMSWTDLASHTCTTYATREYTARLVNIPSSYNRRVEACMATPIKIHETEYMPQWCEDHGPNNVIGHWEVNQHEPDCAPYWNWYKDLGCISPGSGQRRIQHHLKNLPSGADWKEFCATTPVSFNGMHFMGAESCFRKYFGIFTYGQWVVDDESCRGQDTTLIGKLRKKWRNIGRWR